MKRNELLKLRPGKYLVMGQYDSLMVLHKYDTKTNEDGNSYGVCQLFDYYATRSEGIFISYCKKSQYCSDCGEYREEVSHKCGYGYEFTCSSGFSAMKIHTKFDRLYEIKLVGLYNQETIKEDVEKFKIHQYINEYRYVKSRNKKRIKERIKKN